MSDGNPTSKPSETENRVARNQFCSERRTKDKIFTNRYPKKKKNQIGNEIYQRKNDTQDSEIREIHGRLTRRRDSHPLEFGTKRRRSQKRRPRNEEENGLGKEFAWSGSNATRDPLVSRSFRTGSGRALNQIHGNITNMAQKKLQEKGRKIPPFSTSHLFRLSPLCFGFHVEGRRRPPLFSFFSLPLRARKRGDDIARLYPPLQPSFNWRTP